MSQAPRPDFFTNLPSLQGSEGVKNQEVSVEEQQLYALSEQVGWKVFSSYVAQVMEEMVAANEEAVSQGLSLEDIGLNTAVIAKTKRLVRQIMNKVEDAREACQKPDGSGQ